jgi:hypothetical protein
VASAVKGIERLTKLHQIPTVVWIDDHNLIRRMQLSFNESVASGQTANAKITVDFVKYGSQPKPVLPPPDQVTDASALAAGASGASGSSG